MNKHEDFKIFVENFLFAYRQFCLNEVLHEKIDSELYKKYIATWNTILLSLEANYLLGLAKVFDKSGESGQTISIYYFLDNNFAVYENLIGKIRKLRNKYFVHLDVKKMRDKEDFLKENQLNRNEIRGLFETIIDVVDKLGKDLTLNEDFKKIFNQTKEETLNESDVWLQPFR
jgi:hypothetical protein